MSNLKRRRTNKDFIDLSIDDSGEGVGAGAGAGAGAGVDIGEKKDALSFIPCKKYYGPKKTLYIFLESDIKVFLWWLNGQYKESYIQLGKSVTNHCFMYLKGIKILDMNGCTKVTDAAFEHLKGIHALEMRGCTKLQMRPLSI